MVGARRRRRGLGPFVARDLCAAGARVPCFLATSPETRDATQRALAAQGIEARGHLELEAMLAQEPLDALAICAPAEAHQRCLEAACAAGLPALCEKPFVWGVPDPARAAARLLGAFAARGLLVVENCPWPYTLAAYERLYPGALDAPPRRFEIFLEPAARGVGMLADSLPHALSVLQMLVPGAPAVASELAFASEDAAAECVRVEFLYSTPAAATRARVRLRRSDARTRSTAIALDGRLARRRVEPLTYQLSFEGDGRRVPLPDPLTALVAGFVAELRQPCPERAAARRREIAERMRLLEEITAAYARSGIPG